MIAWKSMKPNQFVLRPMLLTAKVYLTNWVSLSEYMVCNTPYLAKNLRIAKRVVSDEIVLILLPLLFAHEIFTLQSKHFEKNLTLKQSLQHYKDSSLTE
ncbi:hypothetical protein BLOT_016054 [Blomia tropicalis]|nr:hypothetical protein BLOT_016054 [Blomia tropicalis]